MSRRYQFALSGRLSFVSLDNRFEYRLGFVDITASVSDRHNAAFGDCDALHLSHNLAQVYLWNHYAAYVLSNLSNALFGEGPYGSQAHVPNFDSTGLCQVYRTDGDTG